MHNKKLVAIVCAAVVFIGAVSIFLASRVERVTADNMGSEFAAVYMVTGDIYFGKLDWLPGPRLRNVWYMQRSAVQGQESQLGLAPLKGAFWTPIDEIYLNMGQIVFWTRVKAGSQMAQALQNPEAFGQSAQQMQQYVPPAPAPEEAE